MTDPPAARHSLGGAALGNLYEAMSDDEAGALVAAAWDCEVRHFDTAPHYGAGLSEERVGRALAAYPRAEARISTKVGRLLVADHTPGADRSDGGDLFVTGRPWRRERDYTRDGVLRSLDASLLRLGTDRVDTVFVHDPDGDEHMRVALEQAFPVLEELRSQGVIRSYGAGMNSAGSLLRVLGETDSDYLMMAGRYTLLEHEDGRRLLDAARGQGVRVILAGVFGSGLFADAHPERGARYAYAPASEEQLAFAHRVADIAREHGTTLPHVAVHFALRGGAAAVCLGAASADQVRTHAELIRHPPPEGVWRDLASAGLLPSAAPAEAAAEPSGPPELSSP